MTYSQHNHGITKEKHDITANNKRNMESNIINNYKTKVDYQLEGNMT